MLRAMSAGVVAVGDKAGFIDVEIIRKLCFPDGRLAKPDHPPIPVVSTLQSDILATYTTTTVGAFRWVYLALFNVGEKDAHYQLDVQGLSDSAKPAVYDYFAGKVLHSAALEGDLEPAQGHYYVIMPQVGEISFLGFPGKYITVSSRQVVSIEAAGWGISVEFRLPCPSSDRIPADEHLYTVAVHTPLELDVEASGAEIRRVRPSGGLLYVDFASKSGEPSLRFRMVNRADLR